MSETFHFTKPRPQILIVDDVEDVSNLFSELLRREVKGCAVVSAPSAAAALTAARAESFDLIIADIGMPGISGYELAAQLRALPEYRHVPLLAVSGFGEYDDRGQALAAGFTEYLVKTVDPALFVETVERLLTHSFAEDSPASSQ